MVKLSCRILRSSLEHKTSCQCDDGKSSKPSFCLVDDRFSFTVFEDVVVKDVIRFWKRRL